MSRSPEATVEQEARFNGSLCGACLMAAVCMQVGVWFFFLLALKWQQLIPTPFLSDPGRERVTDLWFDA